VVYVNQKDARSLRIKLKVGKGARRPAKSWQQCLEGQCVCDSAKDCKAPRCVREMTGHERNLGESGENQGWLTLQGTGRGLSKPRLRNWRRHQPNEDTSSKTQDQIRIRETSKTEGERYFCHYYHCSTNFISFLVLPPPHNTSFISMQHILLSVLGR
jgi:hypothetical protein